MEKAYDYIVADYAGNKVKVNGEVDTRRGRKLYPGDVFSYNDMEAVIE